MRQAMAWIGLVSVLAACGDDEGLSKAEVTDIPSGDALGDEHSGQYTAEVYTSDCSGACLAQSGGFTLSFCDVGERDDEDFEATQTDGELVVDGDDNLYASRLEGGIDADGGFDVGGYGTENGGQIEATVRFRGTISSTGEVTGTATARIKGDDINCTATYDVTAQRHS